MLKLSVLFLFFRTIPEGILLIFANYVAINKTIDKKIILSGILFGLYTYVIRFLSPVLGLNTVIGLCLYIFLSVKVNTIDFYKSTQLCILWTITLAILDLSLVYIYINLLHIRSQIFLNDDFIGLLLGMPSFILFSIIILVLHMKNIQKNYRKGKF